MGRKSTFRGHIDSDMGRKSASRGHIDSNMSRKSTFRGHIISNMSRKSAFRRHIDSNIDKLLLQMKEEKDKEKMLCTLSGKNEYRVFSENCYLCKHNDIFSQNKQ